MIKFERGTICFTRGDGYWSDVERAVELLAMDLACLSADGQFGELRVYFNSESWDVDKDGLIYSDEGFEREFKQLLARTYGFSESALAQLYYSEQGMQGRKFVSFDCDTAFIKEFFKRRYQI
jgi:hypothetical protein